VEAKTGYAKSGATHIAYSESGDGPLDLQYLSSYTISIDSLDEEPHVAHFFRRLESFSRVGRHDVRGVGLSDPLDLEQPVSVESLAADVLAVLDARGVERTALIGEAGGGYAAIELAAAHPDRVSALVLINSFARIMADDDYPAGHPRELLESFLDQNIDPDGTWEVEGNDDLALVAPSLRSDARFVDWWHRSSRRGASPATARALLSLTTLGDVRDRLPMVKVPTLVIHRAGNQFVPPGLGRYLGEHIDSARYVELPGADHATWAGNADDIVDEIEEFLTGQRTTGGERVLATVVFTDIVDSTGRAAALGDQAWRTYLDTHDAIVRGELRRFGGREVNTTGDGFFSAFESPTQAVRGTQAIVAAAAAQGIAIRVGIHTGECERRGDDLAGLTVHIAARVAAIAASGEVLVSRTVRDLVGGSDLQFVPRGEYLLKGVPETWQLFALVPAEGSNR
jgi:pimeloyl-ACP methyl ester carboxylesterase